MRKISIVQCVGLLLVTVLGGLPSAANVAGDTITIEVGGLLVMKDVNGNGLVMAANGVKGTWSFDSTKDGPGFFANNPNVSRCQATYVGTPGKVNRPCILTLGGQLGPLAGQGANCVTGYGYGGTGRLEITNPNGTKQIYALSDGTLRYGGVTGVNSLLLQATYRRTQTADGKGAKQNATGPVRSMKKVDGDLQEGPLTFKCPAAGRTDWGLRGVVQLL